MCVLRVEPGVMCMWAGMGLLSCVLGVVTCHNTSYLGRAQSVPRKAVPDVAPKILRKIPYSSLLGRN